MGINISKDYISSLGLETVEEAFNLVKTHCFTNY